MRISDWSSDVCSSDLLQHPEEPSLGHSLPVKAGTDGSLPPIIRADAPLHPARGPSVPATPYATDRAGCYDVLILQPEAESPDRSAPNAAAVWLLAAAPGSDAMLMLSARPNESGPHLLDFRAGDAAPGMKIGRAPCLHQSLDLRRRDKRPLTTFQHL